jgi:hypothetical protein
MASEDDKQEDEEFEDIPSEVEGDASEVGNSSAQEKFDKLKKVVKENSKKEANKKEKEEEKKKEDSKQEKKKKRKKEEKKRRKRTPSPSPSSSSSSSSSSSENGDGDDEYYDTRIPKRTIKPKPKPKAKDDYKSVSFNYDSLDTKSKDDVTIPVGKLPQFDGTNFAKWKHMMKAYLTGLSLELWNIVCVGFDDLEDFRNLTPHDRRNIRRNAQATSILLSALNAEQYNHVSGLEIAKYIWDILHNSHEGVDKVKKSKINILMAELNRSTIFDGEGPQEMFDRLMVIVGKIRGLGGDELDEHFVVKVMLEAFALRNPTLVTLIREKKIFEEFSPNDVLGRILTHEPMDKEIQHRKKIDELEAKLNNLKVKEVALHSYKSSKPSTSSKNTTPSKPSKSKSKKVEVERSTRDSSEDENEGSHVEIGDMALFMKTYKKGLKKQGYKFAKRRFPNKKKRSCYICGSTEHFIADCPNEKRENKNDKGKGGYKKDQRPHHCWGIQENPSPSKR